MEIALATLLIGAGSMYYPGDGHCGDTRADNRPFKEGQHHVACRRPIPLGAKGWLCSVRTKRCTLVSCRDRGPFGATKDGKWEVQIRLKPGWKRRAVLDLTRSAAKAIGFRGWPEKVVWIWKKK